MPAPPPPSAALPLFPLSHVLLPGALLPLRIFEPRYRQLLADVCGPDGSRSFGVVALLSGSEVARPGDDSPPTVAPVGTVAEIRQVERASDGTADVLAVGTRRFRVAHLLDGPAPYLRASVSYLDEPIGPLPSALLDSVRLLANRHAGMLAAITGQSHEDVHPSDPVALSYLLAATVPLPALERQQLLSDPSASERLRRLLVLLRRELILLRRTRTIAVSRAVLQLPVVPN